MNRLTALRQLISQHHLDGYLITDSDYHYTFYSVAHHDRRINWITECQAQCGLALVTLNHCAVFESPSNYRLLARKEMNQQCWIIVDNLIEWIKQYKSSLGTIGYDPRRTPIFVMRRFSNVSSDQCCFQSVPSSMNWIDRISDRKISSSSHILTPIWSLNERRFAGQRSEDKIKTLREVYLRDTDVSFTLVTTALDEIAWLLNLRANDMECNPLFYSFMIVSEDRLILFIDNPHQVRRKGPSFDHQFFFSRIYHTISVHMMLFFLFFHN